MNPRYFVMVNTTVWFVFTWLPDAGSIFVTVQFAGLITTCLPVRRLR